MNIKLIVIGKTDEQYLEVGIEKYFKRISRYVNYSYKIINDIKNTRNLSEDLQKQQEGEKILHEISNSDILVLLDEKGKTFNSKEFSEFISKQMLSGIKNLFFVIGGPYGFSKDVYNRANYKLALSKMTFSHQIVRAIFAEQLYRAMTIIKGEQYHH